MPTAKICAGEEIFGVGILPDKKGLSYHGPTPQICAGEEIFAAYNRVPDYISIAPMNNIGHLYQMRP